MSEPLEEMITLGQIGYEAYGQTAGWKTFDGRAMPTWDELGKTDSGKETQRRWEVAATEITFHVIDRSMIEALNFKKENS